MPRSSRRARYRAQCPKSCSSKNRQGHSRCDPYDGAGALDPEADRVRGNIVAGRTAKALELAFCAKMTFWGG